MQLMKALPLSEEVTVVSSGGTLLYGLWNHRFCHQEWLKDKCLRQVDINHFIILSWGFWTLLKINSAEGLEKLHRAVLIQLVLIVFHQDTAMKGIMTVDPTIASNHWLENCHTLDWLLWSSATLKRASDLKTKKELFRWKWQITNDLSQPGLQNC